MKKQFLSFVMMLALVIVAGTAMAQLNNTPYQGGTYTYKLNGITVVNASTATVTYDGTGATLPTPIAIAIGANQTITFQVTYSQAATSGTLKVNIVDNTSTCNNFIQLAITVKAKPTIDLAIVGSVDDLCQNLNTTPANNTDASVGSTANTFTFTVTPTIVNEPAAGTYTYDYTLALPDAATTGLTNYTITRTSGTGTWTESTGEVVGATTTADQVFTISFNTTTGITAKTITGTLSAVSLTENSGNGNYVETVTTNNEDNVIVKTTPKIGSFTIE